MTDLLRHGLCAVRMPIKHDHVSAGGGESKMIRRSGYLSVASASNSDIRSEDNSSEGLSGGWPLGRMVSLSTNVLISKSNKGTPLER